jgi:DNA-binding IclR family transcriptional regulator
MMPLQPNQSLIDGLACLQALAGSRDPVGVRELARRLDLEPTRVHRLLKTLAHLGLANQTPSKKYVSGAGMHVLAAQSLFASGLIKDSLPVLQSLHKYGMIVALGVLWRDSVSYLYHAEPDMSVETALGRIGLYPATLSSIGMVLLSFGSDSGIRKTFAKKEIPGYPGGIKSLLSKICEIRKKGYALIGTGKDNKSIAVPLGNPPYSAIALSGSMRNSKIKKYLGILKESSEKAQSKILQNVPKNRR